MNKLNNTRTYVYEEDGEFIMTPTKEEGTIHFHSKDEAEYYIYLRKRGLKLGEDFTMQNRYELIPKYGYMGRLQRGVTYIDDFRIWDYIIDIKGMETDHYKIKAQMMKKKCDDESTEDKPLYYLALYDLKNHKEFVYKLMPHGIRYMDIQMVKDLNKRLKKVTKGKGVMERKKEEVRIFLAEYTKLANVVTNVTISAIYFQ